jgi:hypothetical protein
MSFETSWLDNQPPRLGDLIDDYCPRCKHLLNHAIASFVDDKVVKVICQTCFSEHPFMEGKEKKKTPKSGSSAFDQVLAKVAPSGGDPQTDSKQKKAKPRARYISRHKTKAPRDKK